MLGPGKIGKSDFWSRGEKTLFLECEPGLNHLEVMSLQCRGWSDIQQAGGLLYKAWEKGGLLYDTLVIDTADRFVAYANEEIITRAKEKYKEEVASKINSIGDIPNGSGWYWSTELVTNALRKFTDLPLAVVLIAHVERKTVEEPTRKYTRETISIGGQTGTNILHWADHTLLVRARQNGDKIERCLRTKPMDSMEAGSRGNIVEDGFMWEASMAENYRKFRALFE